MASTTLNDLIRSTVPVLWSVALSRLALAIAALVFAYQWTVPAYAVSAQVTVPSGPDWLSRVAGVALVVVWAGLEATPRLDPGWRQTVRRRRMVGKPPVGPDLATPALAQVTGVAAGVAAVSAGLLLVAEPLTDLDPLAGVQAVALALLAAGVLAVGTPAVVGRTVLAAATAGLAAGLVTLWLVAEVSIWLADVGDEQFLGWRC